MDRYGIAKGNRVIGPVNVRDALFRARELMAHKMSQIPPSAGAYARYLGNKYGNVRRSNAYSIRPLCSGDGRNGY